MTRILHLSDLHFGRTRPELLPPLLEAAAELRPDLIALSGDMTQRAREWQFAAAARFIAALPAPVLCVPGNHDIPLDRPVSRLIRPRNAYRWHISRETEPVIEMPGLVAIGIDSSDPFAWQRGRIGRLALARAAMRLRAADPEALKIVVMHHPLVHPPGSDKEVMPRAPRIARTLAEAGADIVLAGHLHSWGVAPEALDPHDTDNARRAMLLIRAGTGLSSRLRGEENDFNVIDDHDRQSPHRLTVTRYTAQGPGHHFRPAHVAQFIEGEAGWHAIT